MDRRAVGAVLLGLALLAAAVVPSLAAERIPGIPVAESVPGPPAVGQCVLRPVQPRLSISGFSAVVLSYGSCTGLHYGEVVEILDYGSSKTGNNWPGNAVGQMCSKAAISYLGMKVRTGSGDLAVDSWSAMFHHGATAGIPDAAQSAAGQHWVACTLFPQTTDRTRTGYRGQNRDVLRSGRLSDGLGVCGNNPVVDAGSSVPCDRPHRYQAVGEALATVGSRVPKLQRPASIGANADRNEGHHRERGLRGRRSRPGAVVRRSSSQRGDCSSHPHRRYQPAHRSLLGLGTAAVPIQG
ncbi:MAG: hypothetical protein WKF57_10420 [Nakamurella sp.]